jgi:hypothetical protein
MQVDPIQPVLKPLGTKRLKLKYHKLLSNFAFNFNVCRYTGARVRDVLIREESRAAAEISAVRRCRLKVSKPVLKAPIVSARLKLHYDESLPSFALNFNLRCYSAADAIVCRICHACRKDTVLNCGCVIECCLTQETVV